VSDTTELIHQTIGEIMAIGSKKRRWDESHTTEVEKDPGAYVLALLLQVKSEVEKPAFKTTSSTVMWSIGRVNEARELIAQHKREASTE
jgi:hypothetical protein